MNDYIRFVTWNLDYWKRICEDRSKIFCKTPEIVNLWKENVKYNLSQLHSDFILLQEINPFNLYDIEYIQNESSYYETKNNRNNIFYYELAKELENYVTDAKFWGLSIIADEKYKFLNKIIYRKNPIFMCLDFQLTEDKVITIINIYNKKKYDYNISNDFLSSLNDILKTKCNNMVILAGDFNSKADDINNKFIFDSIVKMGFKNRTGYLGTTMVFYSYQNDHIFVNNNMDKYIMNIKEFSQWNITDHFGLSCTIKL